MKYLPFVLLLLSVYSKAQRVEFNDPDLSFSFVKPDSWVVDDGPTVFVYPEDESSETPLTFFSITYFEEPAQDELNENISDAKEIAPSIPSDLKEFEASKTGRTYILDQTVLWSSYYHTQDGVRIKAISYVFMRYNQRFEMKVSAPIQKFEQLDQDFQSIIDSLLINKV